MKKILILFLLLFAGTPLFAGETLKSEPVDHPNDVTELDKDEIEGTISFEMRRENKVQELVEEDEDYLDEIDMGVYLKVEDPFEDYNRFMFDFNDGLYKITLDPLAKGYAAVLPSDFRVALSNLFDNIAMPIHLISSLLQGDGEKAARVLKRFVINTTLGMGGMGDVAAYNFELPKVSEDMEQALTNNNVAPGAYIVWPFIGPTTAAGTVGKMLDTLLNPVTWVAPQFSSGTILRSEQILNEYSFDPEMRKKITRGSIDPYLATRNAFLQYRERLLNQ